MRSLLLLFVIVASTLANDGIELDIDSILETPERADSLYNCVMDRGSCNLDESLIRALIRGAFAVSENVPEYVRRYVLYLAEKDEDRFFELAGRYDKEDGIFKKLYYNRNRKCARN